MEALEAPDEGKFGGDGAGLLGLGDHGAGGGAERFLGTAPEGVLAQLPDEEDFVVGGGVESPEIPLGEAQVDDGVGDGTPPTKGAGGSSAGGGSPSSEGGSGGATGDGACTSTPKASSMMTAKAWDHHSGWAVRSGRAAWRSSGEG